MTVTRGELGVREIRRAGLGIVSTDGLDAVSMRRIADALGVWPTAVYHHVGDKEGLVRVVLDGVLDELTVPAPDLPWDEWMRAFARATRELLLRYPGVATHLAETGAGSQGALGLMDSALGVLARDGFGPRDAVVVFVDFFGFVLSRIRREETIASAAGHERLVRTLTTAHDAGWDLPHVAASRAVLTDLPATEYLDAGIEMLIRGAEHLRHR